MAPCKIPLVTSIAMRILHQKHGYKVCEISRDYPKFARRSISRHVKLPIPTDDTPLFDKRKTNPGRPRILTLRDERKILRTIPKLRREIGCSFNVPQIKKASGVNHISNRTVRYYLNKNGFFYRHSRKKGLVSAKDRNIRVKFAKKVISKLTSSFWNEGISFYIDGVGFTHKTNPDSHARNNGSMAYRLRREGLDITTKGKKEGVNGQNASFFVAIAYNKGVVLCEQFKGKFNGESYSEFVREHFPDAFKSSANPRGMLFLQDGDPTQNSKKAKAAYDDVGCRMFSIPARSPDINPIENVFNIVRAQLTEIAMSEHISHETYDQFCDRVKATLLNFSPAIIDSTIDSMPKRMRLILKGKGKRTKY